MIMRGKYLLAGIVASTLLLIMMKILIIIKLKIFNQMIIIVFSHPNRILKTNLKTESMEIMKRLQMKVIQLVTINQTILRIKNLHLSKQRMLSMIGIKIKDLDIV